MAIKVLIVDDSALIRSVLKEIIESHVDMKVVGAAPDPLVAREMIKQLKMIGMLRINEERHLMSTKGAFDLQTVNHFWSRPALR